MTTAIVSVILLNRQYAKLQWIALVCLGVGVALVVLGESSSEGEDKDINLSVGLIAVALASLSSAFAGVWFEKVVKGVSAGANGGPAKTTSLWVRNVELAFFSLVFASAYGAWESMMKAPEEAIDAPAKPFLHGELGSGLITETIASLTCTYAPRPLVGRLHVHHLHSRPAPGRWRPPRRCHRQVRRQRRQGPRHRRSCRRQHYLLLHVPGHGGQDAILARWDDHIGQRVDVL